MVAGTLDEFDLNDEDFGLEEPVGRVLTIFFIVDVSGSMAPIRIAAVNDAIDNSQNSIINVQNGNLGQTIKVALLTFGGANDVAWLTPTPVKVSDYTHKTLSAKGQTPFGIACKELRSKLSTKEFMHAAKASYAPVFILLSDGGPTDSWEAELKELKENGWFKCGTRLAIDIDGKSDRSVLEEFTGNAETVLESDGPEQLKDLIRFASVTSSMVASAPLSTDPENDKNDLNDATEDLAKIIKANGGVEGILAKQKAVISEDDLLDTNEKEKIDEIFAVF